MKPNKKAEELLNKFGQQVKELIINKISQNQKYHRNYLFCLSGFLIYFWRNLILDQK